MLDESDTSDRFTSTEPETVRAVDEQIWRLADTMRPEQIDMKLECSPKRVREALARRPAEWQAPERDAGAPPVQAPPAEKTPKDEVSEKAESAPVAKPAGKVGTKAHHGPKHGTRADAALARRIQGARLRRAVTSLESGDKFPLATGVPDEAGNMIKLVLHNALIEFGSRLDDILSKNKKDGLARSHRFAILLVLEAYKTPVDRAGEALGLTATEARKALEDAKADVQRTSSTARFKTQNLAKRLGLDPDAIVGKLA